MLYSLEKNPIWVIMEKIYDNLRFCYLMVTALASWFNTQFKVQIEVISGTYKGSKIHINWPSVIKKIVFEL